METPVEYRGGLVHEVIALTAQLGDVAADAYAIGKLVELLRANLVHPGGEASATGLTCRSSTIVAILWPGSSFPLSAGTMDRQPEPGRTT